MRRSPIQGSITAALAVAFAGWSIEAMASGFQLQEQNASGLGLAYSGQAAAVHDASTVFWNPAGMSLLPGKQVTASLNYIMPSTKFSDSGSTFSALGSGGQGAEDGLVPALYGTWMINQQWSVGLGVGAPFGLATEWDSRWAGQFHALRSEVKTLNINPSVSFKVNDMVSLGAGVSYQQLEAELTNAGPLATTTSRVKGDSWEWGWNVGALFNFNQGATRVGVTYRSAIKHTVEGDLTFTGTPPLPSQPVKAEIKLPDTFSIGLSQQLNRQMRLLADWTYTGWDSIQELKIVSRNTGGTIATTDLKFKDSWRVGVGMEYQLNQPWLLRFGLAYDNTPVQDAFRTPRLPDEDRIWFSVGGRYMPAANWWLDFGYTYIMADEAKSQLPVSPQGSLNGEYKADVHILGVQASYKF